MSSPIPTENLIGFDGPGKYVRYQCPSCDVQMAPLLHPPKGAEKVVVCPKCGKSVDPTWQRTLKTPGEITTKDGKNVWETGAGPIVVEFDMNLPSVDSPTEKYDKVKKFYQNLLRDTTIREVDIQDPTRKDNEARHSSDDRIDVPPVD